MICGLVAEEWKFLRLSDKKIAQNFIEDQRVKEEYIFYQINGSIKNNIEILNISYGARLCTVYDVANVIEYV